MGWIRFASVDVLLHLPKLIFILESMSKSYIALLSHSQDFLKTSDLEVKVSEILTRSRFLSIWISCVASFSSYLHHKLECLPCPPTCQGYDNTQSGLYSWRVKMNFRISKSVLTEHNVFLQNTIKIPDEDYLSWKAATVMEPFKSKTVVSYIVPQRIKCEI